MERIRLRLKKRIRDPKNQEEFDKWLGNMERIRLRLKKRIRGLRLK